MRLHVLVGCGALLRPLLPPPAALAALAGPAGGAPLHAPAANWLARGAGAVDHDFLLQPEEDDRIAVFAAALRENYGLRFEPLALLPDALGTPGDPAAAPAALAALRALWRLRPADRLVLHALVLPAMVGEGDGDGGDWVAAAGLTATTGRQRLEALRASLAVENGDAEAIEIATVETRPGDDVFGAALRNALAHEVALRAGARLAVAGLAPTPRLTAACARRLAAWDAQGAAPALPLDADRLGRLTERLVDSLLGGESGNA